MFQDSAHGKFNRKIKEILEKVDRKSIELAKKLDISRSTTWRWENEESADPKFTDLYNLGQQFNINMNWLFFDEGEMFRADPPTQDNVIHLHEHREEYEPAKRDPIEIRITDRQLFDFIAKHSLNDDAYRILHELGASQDLLAEVTHHIVNLPLPATAETYKEMRRAMLEAERIMTEAGATSQEIIQAIVSIVARPF